MATSGDSGIMDFLSLPIAATTASILPGSSGTPLLTSRRVRKSWSASIPVGAMRLSIASPNPDGTLKGVLFGAKVIGQFDAQEPIAQLAAHQLDDPGDVLQGAVEVVDVAVHSVLPFRPARHRLAADWPQGIQARSAKAPGDCAGYP